MIETLRKDLMQAMKDKDTNKKEVLQLLIAGIVNKEKALRHKPTEDDEVKVIMTEKNQIEDTISMTPESRVKMLEDNKYKLNVVEHYLPKMMTEHEISVIINEAIEKAGLNRDSLTARDKGKIMKEIMPIVKGKADGKVVNSLVQELFNK